MKIRGRKGTKVIAALLCQCMVLSMVSMNAQAATVDDNPATEKVDISAGDVMGINNGIVNQNYGIVQENNGTVNSNYGTVETNKKACAVVTNYRKATVQENEGAVTDNEGTVVNNKGIVHENNGTVVNNFGTVTTNYGRVEKNFGTVTANATQNDKKGTVIEEFRKIDIVGSNYNLMGDVGIANNASWAIIKDGNVITLIANPGYHFASAPTTNDTSCTITHNGSNYEIRNILDNSEPLVIILSIVKDPDPTPDPNPTPDVTPTSDDNNDNHHDTTKTVETPSKHEVYMQTQIAKIQNTQVGGTVVLESDSYHSYSHEFMKELLERRNVAVRMSYNYMGMHYEVVIPPNYKFVLDDDVPWYGPLKLAVMFGAVITPIEN